MLTPLEFSDTTTSVSRHLILPMGTWQHQIYGRMSITADYIEQIIKNHERIQADPELRDPAVLTEHEWSTAGAYGWIQSLENAEGGLYATIEWTDIGMDARAGKRFKYLSPQIGSITHPRTREIITPALIETSLTNRPFFGRQLAAADLAAADADWQVNINVFNLPVVADTAVWCESLAIEQIERWATDKDGDTELHWGKYAHAFLIHDTAHPGSYYAYRWPVAEVIDNELRLHPGALQCALRYFTESQSIYPALPKQAAIEAITNYLQEDKIMTTQQNPTAQQFVTPEQFAELQAQTGELARQNRRLIFTETLNGIRFNDGKLTLAPASRLALLDAIANVDDQTAQAIVNAVQNIQFVQLGEIGTNTPTNLQPGETRKFSDVVDEIAKERNLSYQDAYRVASEENPDLFRKEYLPAQT